MDRVAVFSKVSKEEFVKDSASIAELGFSEEEISKMYDRIVLPERATIGSAGYDFRSPFSFLLDPGQTMVVPTGIRCKIKDGWFLSILPRSGLGFKYREMLANTVGIVDSDYYGSDNEGHIFLKIVNASTERKRLVIREGDAFAQGIFIRYGITESDDVQTARNGGMGSTGA